MEDQFLETIKSKILDFSILLLQVGDRIIAILLSLVSVKKEEFFVPQRHRRYGWFRMVVLAIFGIQALLSIAMPKISVDHRIALEILHLLRRFST